MSSIPPDSQTLKWAAAAVRVWLDALARQMRDEALVLAAVADRLERR